jgi:hypothetical protein
MVDEIKGGMKKFNGTNFQWWKIQMEDYLYQKNMYLPLIGKRPKDMSDDEWKILDRKALAQIRLCLTKSVGFNVSKQKTTKGVMEHLTKLYEKPSTSNRLFLMKKLFNMRMSESMSILEHLNDFNTLWSQLESVEVTFSDDIKALIFLLSLPDSWNNFVMTFGNTPGASLKFDDVIGSVMNSEMMRKSAGESSSSAAALSVDRGRSTKKENSS